MFFVISKLLYFVLKPINWVVILLLLALFHRKNGRLKRRCLRISVGIVLVMTNPLLLQRITTFWEGTPIEITQLHAPYDYGIVLGGYTHTRSVAPSQPVFNMHGNRIFQAIRLYKMGIIKRILLTGGSGRIINTETPEANTIKKYLLEIGIPEQDIRIDSLSRTTSENATYTRKILQNTNTETKCLLITSAFHIRRSTATFQRAGIPHDIFPTDFIAIHWTPTPENIFMPDETGLYKWQLLIKEWVGCVIYKIRGQL